MATPKKVILSLPRRPDEEDAHEVNPTTFEHQEESKSSIWGDTTPFKKLMGKQRRRSSFGGTQFQETCKKFREICSPEKCKDTEQEQMPPLPTPRSSKEDVQIVYDRFETLLNVLRIERHKEKRESEEEVQALRNRIALLEQTNITIVNDSAKPKRKSLGAITNVLPSLPSPSVSKQQLSEQVSEAKPSSKEYEEKILESVRQLMDKEYQFEPEMDRKLLAWYFDEESGDKASGNERDDLKEEIRKDYELDVDEIALRYFTALKEIQQQHHRVMDEVAKNSVLAMELEQAKGDLTRARKNLSGDQVFANAENAVNNSNDHGKEIVTELKDEITKLKSDLALSQQNHHKALMEAEIQSTQKKSLSAKLDAALSQVAKQKDTISLLNEELGKARYECDLYSKQAHDVLEESKQLLVDDAS